MNKCPVITKLSLQKKLSEVVSILLGLCGFGWPACILHAIVHLSVQQFEIRFNPSIVTQISRYFCAIPDSDTNNALVSSVVDPDYSFIIAFKNKS